MSDDIKIPRDATFPSLTRPEGFDVYASAYWLAAEHLYERNWRNDGMPPRPDFISIPLLFLLHHFIELELKEIVRRSSSVGDYMARPPIHLPSKGSHSLTKLLKDATENLTVLCPEEMPLFDDQLTNIIADLDKFGMNGEALRYPETTPNQGSVPTISRNYVADVPVVMDAMKRIRDKLAGAIGQLIDIEEYYQDERQQKNDF